MVHDLPLQERRELPTLHEFDCSCKVYCSFLWGLLHKCHAVLPVLPFWGVGVSWCRLPCVIRDKLRWELQTLPFSYGEHEGPNVLVGDDVCVHSVLPVLPRGGLPWGVIPPWLAACAPTGKPLLQVTGPTCELNEINRLRLARFLKPWCQKCDTVAEKPPHLCHLYHGILLALGGRLGDNP